jgi:hypothetical protein
MLGGLKKKAAARRRISALQEPEGLIPVWPSPISLSGLDNPSESKLIHLSKNIPLVAPFFLKKKRNCL